MEMKMFLSDATFKKGTIYGMPCLICEGERLSEMAIPDGYTKFEIRESNGDPASLENHVKVDYWGYILVQMNPIGRELERKITTTPEHYLNLLPDGIGYDEDGLEYKFIHGNLIPVDYRPSGKFEIYYEDLTPDAQKRYLKFMKVRSAKELNMDMPGVFPVTIIEY